MLVTAGPDGPSAAVLDVDRVAFGAADDGAIATANIRHATKSGTTWSADTTVSLDTANLIYSVTGAVASGSGHFVLCE